MCARCGSLIVSEYISAMGKMWHQVIFVEFSENILGKFFRISQVIFMNLESIFRVIFSFNFSCHIQKFLENF